MFDPVPVVLEGECVRLEPLGLEHAADLFRAGNDPHIWTYMPRGPLEDVEDARRWIEDACHEMAEGRQVAFAIVSPKAGAAIGSTRFLSIRREHRSLEIGWTWLALDHQRTRANTECKQLLLTHAFEALGALRVEFKTDERNIASQKALRRIGATHEGVLRKHMRVQHGFARNSVYFSIIDTEWPKVKEHMSGL